MKMPANELNRCGRYFGYALDSMVFRSVGSRNITDGSRSFSEAIEYKMFRPYYLNLSWPVLPRLDIGPRLYSPEY